MYILTYWNFIDIYLHSLRKMWYLIELSGGESIGMVSSSEMKESIVKECKQQKLPHVVSLPDSATQTTQFEFMIVAHHYSPSRE